MSDECCARTRLECENECDEYVKKLEQQLAKLKAEKDKALSIIKGIRDHGYDYDYTIMYDFLEEQGE